MNKLKLTAAALAAVAVATLAAGGIAMASMDNGLGRMGRADANNDGQISRAEWVQAATARFDRFDADKDGTLVAAELPKKHGRGRHHGPRDGNRDWAPGAAPQPAAPASPAPQQ
ncbi:hypothetical protein [Sphingomonas sp. LM7]|uniref:hypothetical protein n=1 Tax=Sphingomonas sp. LM7 TaxID=1938607 RepID=UPI00098401DF|nr:hypothetical protein [Sphingomonas sp. LM7]AQR72766.1 hypothetical protein BXU08_02955 [Sphingomonas sp. LM7]